jgi:hypothetical protein
MLNSGNVKYTVFVVDPNILVVNGVGVWVFVHEVDPRPVSLSLCVMAQLVLLDSFPSLLLSVSLDLAEVAEFPVPVTVASSA